MIMGKRSADREGGLPPLVLDLRDLPRVADTPRVHYRRPGRINKFAVEAQAYANSRLPRPNRHFLSMFGPGGLGGGYSDSSWI